MAVAEVPGARPRGWPAGRSEAEAREEAAKEGALQEEEATVETEELEAAEALAAPRPEWQAERRAVACLVLAVEATEAEGSVEVQTGEEADTGARPTELPVETRAAGWVEEQEEGMAAELSAGTESSAAAEAPVARPKVEPAEREEVEGDPR
jgi:hypothetical protein